MFRALCDVNLPKFLANDLKLFEGILADLFPNLKFTPPEYGNHFLQFINFNFNFFFFRDTQ